MSVALLPPALARAVSPYTGIVSSLEECLQSAGEPPLFRYSCEVARGEALLGSPLQHVAGVGGAGPTRRGAVAAAVGEALERYSATHVPLERIVWASAAELGGDAVDPQRFALFSDRQHREVTFPFVRFDDQTSVPWIDGRSLEDGRSVYLPAELVVLGDPIEEGQARIGYATSNGTACAPTEDEAIVRGLCELLERDAFMIAWANRLSLPRLDVGGDPALDALDYELFASSGLRYAAIDLSCFHELPSFLGVVRAPIGYPGALGVGAGTAAVAGDAWSKSLCEAFACRAASAKLLALDPDADYGPGGAGVLGFEDHIRYYGDHARVWPAAFLDASKQISSVADVPAPPGDLAAFRSALLDRIHRAGSTAYVVDLTSPDVRELDLSVTKTVAPELAALDVAHAWRFLGGRRLYDVPVELGFRDEPIDEEVVNPYPHPFP